MTARNGTAPAGRSLLRLLVVCLALVAAPACNRNVEPFDPEERAEAPDLSRIFPPGAERAARRDAAAGPGGSAPPAAGLPPGVAQAPSGEPVSGTLELAPEFAGRTPAGAVLFLIARRAGTTGGPPVAVKRVPEPRFPLAFSLGPEDRMIQAVPFEGPFELSARLDADGSATTRTPGDLTGAAAAPVQPGATGIRIVIDQLL